MFRRGQRGRVKDARGEKEPKEFAALENDFLRNTVYGQEDDYGDDPDCRA